MSEADRTITMQMIADEAGVSRMAVSLALRNSPKISVATRQRIQQIAERMGYRPNPLVSALMTQLRDIKRVPKPTTLAYITCFPTADGWRRPGPFVDFYNGAKERAESLGYTLEEWWAAKPGLTEQRLSEILYHRNIHGLLIAPLPAGGSSLKLEWSRFASATIAFTLASPQLHRTSNDQYMSIGLAIDEVRKLGYRRIGLAITEEEDIRVQRKWSAGYLVYQQSIDEALRVPPLLATGAFPSACVEWYKKYQPDVILSQDFRLPEFLRQVGVSVPNDVGFVNLALTDMSGECAGINQNSRLVGAGAIDLIDGQLNRNERGVPAFQKTMMVPGRWVSGGTLVNVSNRKKATPKAKRKVKAA